MLFQLDRRSDDRGYFQQNWSHDLFGSAGINVDWDHSAFAYNNKKHTLRGLHYQRAPYDESKTVQCIRGSVFDVVVDLRVKSPTYLKWESFNLSAADSKMLFLPNGFAHGYLTLEPDTLLFYHLSKPYSVECATGILWSDPTLKIDWPEISELTISKKDSSLPEYSE